MWICQVVDHGVFKVLAVEVVNQPPVYTRQMGLAGGETSGADLLKVVQDRSGNVRLDAALCEHG
jgi:hypothetical protein